jgi:pimeloyl-ACP methyl ester carboxylesterase
MSMKRGAILVLVGLLALGVCGVRAQSPAAAPTPAPACPASIPARTNDFVKVNGLSLHYQVYGQGAPLLLIHGNGGMIARMRCQIEHFAPFRQVIAADSRDHGESGSGATRLTYEQIADDLAALLTAINIEKADVLGHSDGGIVALLLAIRHPDKVGKVISSSANLQPDPPAVHQEFVDGVRRQSSEAAAMLKAGDTSRDWARRKRQIDLMVEEPHISHADLQKIAAPTLIMGADGDIMPVSHFVEIYSQIPNAQLFIMPGATHGMPVMERQLFNQIAAQFLERPFARPKSTLGPPRPPSPAQ